MKPFLQSNFLLGLLLFPVLMMAQAMKITVDPSGNGDFKTIQEAVNSLPDSSAQDRVVFVKNGLYREKVLIVKHHVVLQGESREKTIISGSIANGVYTCHHPGDRYSGVVNLEGNDITIKSLTIENTYGLTASDSSFQLECVDAKTNKLEKRTIVRYTHQFALRSFKSTRLKVIDCTILGWGADTVAPWNTNGGMYYFKDCTMQGGTDFYCPRGWSYVENCTFICLKTSAAAMWHDGRNKKEEKSVFRNCTFKGPEPYRFGRYHHDAHFYFLDCNFDENMMDTAIFKAATAKEVHWGPREYYYNCHRKGGDYEWHKDNLDKAHGSPSPKAIDDKWTFDGKWEPSY